MKLLMENWREYVAEENERVILTEEELNELLQEIGALKSFMGRMRGGKKFGDHGYGWEAAVEQWEEEDAQKAAQSLGLSGVDSKEDFKAKVQDTIQRAEKSGDPRAKEAVAAITGKIEKSAPVEPTQSATPTPEPPPENGAAVAGAGGGEAPPAEPPTPSGGEEGEHQTSVPGAQVGTADKNELRMVASQLADPYGGGRLKGLKLSPEEMAGVRQFLSDWAKTMNMELMERLLYVFEEQRRGRLQRRAPAQQVAQAGLQPLDLTQIYDIIEDEEKAKLAAAMIAQSLENVGVRALNWREPPRPEVETGTGAEEETGVGGEEKTGVGGEEETGVGGEEETGVGGEEETGVDGGKEKEKKPIGPGRLGGDSTIIADILTSVIAVQIENQVGDRFAGVCEGFPVWSTAVGAIKAIFTIDICEFIIGGGLEITRQFCSEALSDMPGMKEASAALEVIVGSKNAKMLQAPEGDSENIKNIIENVGAIQLVAGTITAADEGLLGEKADRALDTFKKVSVSKALEMGCSKVPGSALPKSLKDPKTKKARCGEITTIITDKIKNADDKEQGAMMKAGRGVAGKAVEAFLDYGFGEILIEKFRDWANVEGEEKKGKEEKGKEEEEPALKVPSDAGFPHQTPKSMRDDQKSMASLQESQLKRWKELAGIIHS